MKRIAKIVISVGALVASIASFAQMPPQYSCTAANARGYTWQGTAYSMGKAQRNALAFCANSGATMYASNCHIVGCTQVGYAPAPVPPPGYGPSYMCVAWGWQHRVSGSASGYNLAKVQWKAVRNCTYNGGVNCQVYSSPSCPI